MLVCMHFTGGGLAETQAKKSPTVVDKRWNHTKVSFDLASDSPTLSLSLSLSKFKCFELCI